MTCQLFVVLFTVVIVVLFCTVIKTVQIIHQIEEGSAHKGQMMGIARFRRKKKKNNKEKYRMLKKKEINLQCKKLSIITLLGSLFHIIVVGKEKHIERTELYENASWKRHDLQILTFLLIYLCRNRRSHFYKPIIYFTFYELKNLFLFLNVFLL